MGKCYTNKNKIEGNGNDSKKEKKNLGNNLQISMKTQSKFIKSRQKDMEIQ